MSKLHDIDRISNLFFDLLQVAIGNRKALSEAPSHQDWQALYKLCHKHTLTGIGFCGMRILPDEQAPDLSLIIHWSGQAEAIRTENEFMNSECQQLCAMLEADGFEGRVLKGQSNFVNYPMVPVALSVMGEEIEMESLGAYRSPGDIDALIRPINGRNSVRRVIEYCIGKAQEHQRTIHHIYYHDTELHWPGQAEVEAHYRAIWLNAPWRNARLQRWLKADAQWSRQEIQIDDVRFYGATTRFNVIYQLLHVYKHLFEEGIGLRQILDYYMVLRQWSQIKPADGNDEVMALLGRFGCRRFAAAMMYVLQCVFQMPDAMLLCAPDVRYGEFLLSEILRAGNFGHADHRLEGHRNYHTFSHAFSRLRRNLKFAAYYPEEVVSELPFSLYHFCWRKLRLWRFSF